MLNSLVRNLLSISHSEEALFWAPKLKATASGDRASSNMQFGKRLQRSTQS